MLWGDEYFLFPLPSCPIGILAAGGLEWERVWGCWGCRWSLHVCHTSGNISRLFLLWALGCQNSRHLWNRTAFPQLTLEPFDHFYFGKLWIPPPRPHPPTHLRPSPRLLLLLLVSRMRVLIREQAAPVRPPAEGNVSLGKTQSFFFPRPVKMTSQWRHVTDRYELMTRVLDATQTNHAD